MSPKCSKLSASDSGQCGICFHHLSAPCYDRKKMASTGLEVPKVEISFDTPNRDRFLREDFHKKRDSYAILGRGSYGVVIKGTYRGRPVAVKILEKRACHHRNDRFDSLLNEANALQIVHDNVVTVLKIVSGPQYGLVLMERFDGHCLQHVLCNQRKHPIAIQHKLLILCDIINGLYFCHRHHIVHLDVKPQNVIVTVNGSTQKANEGATCIKRRRYLCKLCDFGSSMMLASWQRNGALDNRGTIRYMAPELLCGQQRTSGGVTERADIYSFGVTMWQLDQERFPYDEIACNEVVAYNVVKKGLRPDSVTTVTAAFAQRATNLPKRARCFHGSLLFSLLLTGTPSLDARFETEAVDDALKRQGIAVEYRKKAQGREKSPIGAICSEGKEGDQDLVTARLNSMFCDQFRIPGHERAHLRQMIRALYSKCWLTDPASRPNTATVLATIRQALEKVVRCKCVDV